jgi:hypothetical protein
MQGTGTTRLLIAHNPRSIKTTLPCTCLIAAVTVHAVVLWGPEVETLFHPIDQVTLYLPGVALLWEAPLMKALICSPCLVHVSLGK